MDGSAVVSGIQPTIDHIHRIIREEVEPAIKETEEQGPGDA
ncbi:MAG: hypothetical protein ACOCX2_01865 [Armatimonadota bacterium]